MGRDALKLGMIQRMILYCAQILYLKCISELKVDSGDRFPICLLNYVYVKQIGCATTLISKHLNITLEVSTIAESKYNGVEKAVGYVGSNPTIYTKMFFETI